MDLDVVVTQGAGLDIHKQVIVATVITPTLTESRSLGTMTADLLTLADWLPGCGVTHVAMEATGVYWKPVVNLLEAYPFDAVMVVNPQHIQGMPGRKTNGQDSQWIAGLLRIGAMKARDIPPRPQRELRELVRYRTSLQQTRATESNRIQKVLEGANVKLSSVISDVLGTTGQGILAALADGETDPTKLADLADPRIRASRETLIAALTGLVDAHQRLMLRVQLQHVAFLDRQILALSEEVATRLANFDDALTRLQTISGVERGTAETLIAEIGTDMQRFPSAGHLVAWAGFSPGQDQSAGKAWPVRTRKGNKVLRAAYFDCRLCYFACPRRGLSGPRRELFLPTGPRRSGATGNSTPRSPGVSGDRRTRHPRSQLTSTAWSSRLHKVPSKYLSCNCVY